MSVRRLAPAEIQPASFAFTPENESFAASQIAKYPQGRQASAVIPLLWQAQKQQGGWLPKAAIEAVAGQLGMPVIRVMEVASFYTMFNLKPVGRYFIQLCGTVPCHVKGALDLKQVLLERVGDQDHVTPDGNFSWLEVECLGACCNAPMVQINDDYFEDLTPDLLLRLLGDLAAGRPVTPGPQNGRRSSEPEGEATTLREAALFDGSVIGAWRKRFDEEAPTETPTGEARRATEGAASDPKRAKPDSGRATSRDVADTPAKRAKEGDEAIRPVDATGAGDPTKRGVVAPGPETGTRPPESPKSYVATPSNPDAGRVAAGPTGVQQPEAPPARRDGSDTKPIGADKDATPGVAPRE